MIAYDFRRLLNRLMVHIETTKDILTTVHDDEGNYYNGKLMGLYEAYRTMTSGDKATSRQETDCPFCHEEYPIADGIVIKGEHLWIGDKKIWIWYCPICGRRVRKFPDERKLPE